MRKSQARGYLLEVVLEKLLEVNGYDVITEPDGKEIYRKQNGLNLIGRGGFHQFDSLGTLRLTPPFMYPLRIFLEAKFYSNSSKVGIDIVRKGVGILQDVNTNYSTAMMNGDEVNLPRYNYNYTVFSTSGFSKDAQLYALAHKIYLVDLGNEFQSIKQGITNIVDLFASYFRDDEIPKSEFDDFTDFFRNWLSENDVNFNISYTGFSQNENNLKLIKKDIENKAIYLASTNSPQLIPLIPDNDFDFKKSLKISPHQTVQITWNNGNDNWIVTGEDTGVRFRLTFKLPEVLHDYIFSENKDVQVRAYSVKEHSLSKLTFIAYLDNINPTICTLTFDRESTMKIVSQ